MIFVVVVVSLVSYGVVFVIVVVVVVINVDVVEVIVVVVVAVVEETWPWSEYQLLKLASVRPAIDRSCNVAGGSRDGTSHGLRSANGGGRRRTLACCSTPNKLASVQSPACKANVLPTKQQMANQLSPILIFKPCQVVD